MPGEDGIGNFSHGEKPLVFDSTDAADGTYNHNHACMPT